MRRPFLFLAALCAAAAFAATFPVSFWASGFSPASISGLKVWLKADAINQTDGSAVSSWPDSSGNANNATQATGTNQPIFKTAILNGRPIVRFDGTNDNLKTAAFASPLSVSTIFVVAKMSTADQIQYFYDGITTTNRNALLRYDAANGGQLDQFAGTEVFGAFVKGSFVVLSSVFNGASSATYNNGASIISGNVGTQTLTGLSVGADRINVAFLNGDIAEILVYDSALSSTDRAKARTYLSQKYAIPYASAYASDGDTNGVLYFIGSNYLRSTWTNPHTAGSVTVVNTPLNVSGTSASFVNRTLDHSVFTNNVANAIVGVDLGAGRALVPAYYSMRARDDDNTNLPRNWKLQGTNSVSADTEAGFNAATWTDLDTRTSDTTMSVASAWGSFPVTGVSTAYRYLRIVQNGTNSSGQNYFCIQEIELYGTLTY